MNDIISNNVMLISMVSDLLDYSGIMKSKQIAASLKQQLISYLAPHKFLNRNSITLRFKMTMDCDILEDQEFLQFSV